MGLDELVFNVWNYQRHTNTAKKGGANYSFMYTQAQTGRITHSTKETRQHHTDICDCLVVYPDLFPSMDYARDGNPDTQEIRDQVR